MKLECELPDDMNLEKDGVEFKIVGMGRPATGAWYYSPTAEGPNQNTRAQLNGMYPLLEPLRWRAKKGENYYFMTSQGCVDVDAEHGIFVDTHRWEFGNYFQTKAEVQAAAKRVGALFHEIHGGTPAPAVPEPKARWRVEEGKTFWYVDGMHRVQCDNDTRHPLDDLRYESGNYFQTEEQAKAWADYMRTNIRTFRGE
jgi:hypothetical protein